MLVQRNMIKEGRFRRGPTRVREKARGWMWEAEYEVITKDGKMFIFYMWHHFVEDDGSEEWKPSIGQVIKYMYCQFVPCGDGDKHVSHSWHSSFVDGVYYTSKKGFFSYENRNYQEEVIKQIKNGEWEANPDIELLL
jgi:hypothetical protein